MGETLLQYTFPKLVMCVVSRTGLKLGWTLGKNLIAYCAIYSKILTIHTSDIIGDKGCEHSVSDQIDSYLLMYLYGYDATGRIQHFLLGLQRNALKERNEIGYCRGLMMLLTIY